MERIAIIGGGPAGLTAGLYAARGGAAVTLYEELFAGGQIVKTHRVDNYPGMDDGPDGFALGERFARHAAKFGVEPTYSSVLSLTLAGREKLIVTPEGEARYDAVILCMGAAPRKLGLPREEALTGAGLSYCATCDGAFYRGKDVIVVGGGDTAISDAIYLSTLCRRVYVVHRRDELRASAALADAAKRTENIEFVWNSVPEAILGEDAVAGLAVRNVKDGAVRELAAAGLFAAVGVTPRSELVLGELALSANGAILTDSRCKTDLDGVYAAGDVRDTPLRQVVTACADGAIAATSALEYLRARA